MEYEDGPGPGDRGDSNWASGQDCPSAINTGLTDATSPGSGEKKQKVRKPYTITKQRERWTDEEHNRFLEALKLYGRAWRRIEEHIGTKTAVQIRSHAQKFFSKLEKEQSAGLKVEGVPEDLAIPPPRPKRKPAHPYPKKATGSVVSGLEQAPSLQTSQGQQQRQPSQQLQQVHFPDFAAMAQDGEVAEATVAAVAAAASAAAAAAAAAVVAAAGEQVQAQLQASPPQGFPFFGLPPSMLATLGMRSSAMLNQIRAGQQAKQGHHHSHSGQRLARGQQGLGGSGQVSGQEHTATSEPGVRRRMPPTVCRGSDRDSACSAESSMEGKEAARKLQGDTGATSNAARQAQSMQNMAPVGPSWPVQPATRAHSQGAIPADWSSLAGAQAFWPPVAPTTSSMHPAISLQAAAAANAAAASYWGMSQQAYANMPPIAGVLVDQQGTPAAAVHGGHASHSHGSRQHQHAPSSNLTNLANAARIAERATKVQREQLGGGQQDNSSDGSGTDNGRKATDVATVRKDEAKYGQGWRSSAQAAAAAAAAEAASGYDQPETGFDEGGEGSGSNPTGNGGSSGDGGNGNGSSGNGSGNGNSVKDSNNGNNTSGTGQVGSCATKDGLAAVGSSKVPAPGNPLSNLGNLVGQSGNLSHLAKAAAHQQHHSHAHAHHHAAGAHANALIAAHANALANGAAAVGAAEMGSNPTAGGSGAIASNGSDGAGNGAGSNGNGNGSDEGRSSCHPNLAGQAAVPPVSMSGQQTMAYGGSDMAAIHNATAAALQQAGGLQHYFMQSAYNPQLARLQQQALMQWGANASPFEVHNMFGTLFANLQGYTPPQMQASAGMGYEMPKHSEALQMPSAVERMHSAPPAPSAAPGSQPLADIREDALPTPAELGQQGFKPYKMHGGHAVQHAGHGMHHSLAGGKRPPQMSAFSSVEPTRKRNFPG